MVQFEILVGINILLFIPLIMNWKKENQVQTFFRNYSIWNFFYRKKSWDHIETSNALFDCNKSEYSYQEKEYSYDRIQIILLKIIYHQSYLRIILELYIFWILLNMIHGTDWISMMYALPYLYLINGIFIPIIGEIFCIRANKLVK